jgi:hypothetical protein
MVNRETSWENYRVGRNILSPWKHLSIESLGHGERLGKMIELVKL